MRLIAFLPKGTIIELPNGEVVDDSVPVYIIGRTWLSYQGTTPAGGPDPTEFSAECDSVTVEGEDGETYELSGWEDWAEERLLEAGL